MLPVQILYSMFEPLLAWLIDKVEQGGNYFLLAYTYVVVPSDLFFVIPYIFCIGMDKYIYGTDLFNASVDLDECGKFWNF